MFDALDLAWVALGGACGSAARWGLTSWISKKNITKNFPTGTFVVNMLGAFFIAFLTMRYGVDHEGRYSDQFNAFLITGFLGGFTTFSTMQFESYKLLRESPGSMAFLYPWVSTLFGILAAFLGLGVALIFEKP